MKKMFPSSMMGTRRNFLPEKKEGRIRQEEAGAHNEYKIENDSKGDREDESCSKVLYKDRKHQKTG